MAEVKFTINGSKIPVNTAEPDSLLLGEACYHLCQNHMIRFVATPWMIVVEIIVVIVGFIFAPIWCLDILIGMLIAYLLLVGIYLCWYSHFIHINLINKPLCPNCTSRMWQFCCARCHEPIPALAFWLKGAFLTHCPHCGLRLSCRKNTLLAWCPTCSSRFERPEFLYSKPTYIIVWISNTLPKQIRGGWKLVPQNNEHKIVLYHDSDKHSASFLYICTDYNLNNIPIDEHLIGQTRLLLISSNVLEEHANIIKGFFDLTYTIYQTIKPIEEVESYEL